MVKHLFIAWLVCVLSIAHAKVAPNTSADPVLEAKMMVIAEELRCLVCQPTLRDVAATASMSGFPGSDGLTIQNPNGKHHMDAVASLVLARHRSSHQVFIAWMQGAWHLFRSAPFRISALSLLPILVEAALQLIPMAGIVLSKLLTPLAGFWVLAMLDRKARTGTFTPAQARRLWSARFPQLLLTSLLLTAVFAFQLLVTIAIGGIEQALALALGNVAVIDLSRIELAAILVSGLVPASVLMFVAPRVLLDGVRVVYAVSESMRLVGHYRGAVALYLLLFGVLIAGILWIPLLLLMLLPFATCAGYAAYGDVFTRTPTDQS